MEMAMNHQLASLMILFMGLFTSAFAVSVMTTPWRRNLSDAIKEMQDAKYYSFVMLIKMHPLETLLRNVTFFMPSDKILSDSALSADGVHRFLQEHSMPAPLLFDQLRIFPTASMIPTSRAGFMLNVSNNGVNSFFINNVRIVGPNICTSGSSIRIQISSPNICTSSESSIRCHGISGVLGSVRNRSNAPGMMPPRRSSAAPMLLPLKNVVPMPAPAPFGALKSDGPPSLKFGMRVLLKFIATKFVVFTVFGPF
ncbi:hypothetical protein Scep_027047 [Stephania cephalantha]|uniref:FAS1 domain-containing protein n=1 Tax=Stephania cephalantha TaxID=152367 RepID=A0AAP0HNQ2_9MAGN